MLLIYHFDSETKAVRRHNNKELRLELGFFPKPTSRISLRMIGFASDHANEQLHLEFPDVKPLSLERESVDATDEWELPGLGFDMTHGPLSKGRGSFTRGSQTRVVDLDLGYMDPQKDFFRVIINARYAVLENTTDNLNNVSLVFEVHDASAAT